MAGQILNITRKATNITATGAQTSSEALEVLGLPGNRLDFLLHVYVVGGTSSPTLTLTLQTSMTNDDDDNWATLVAFDAVTAATGSGSPPKKATISSGILRFVRWSASVSGTTPVFVVDVTGVAW